MAAVHSDRIVDSFPMCTELSCIATMPIFGSQSTVFVSGCTVLIVVYEHILCVLYVSIQ